MSEYKKNSNINNTSLNNTFFGGVGNHIVSIYNSADNVATSIYNKVSNKVDYVGGKVVSAKSATIEFFNEALDKVKCFFSSTYDGKDVKVIDFHPPKKGEFDINDYNTSNFDSYSEVLKSDELDILKTEITTVAKANEEIQQKANAFTEADESLTQFFKEINGEINFTEEAYGNVVVPDSVLEEWLAKKDKEYHANWYLEPEKYKDQINELESSRKARVQNYDHHGIPLELLPGVLKNEFENEAIAYNLDVNDPNVQADIQRKVDSYVDLWTDRTNALNDKIKNYESFQKFNKGSVVVQGEQIVDLDSYIYAQMNLPMHANNMNERLYNGKQYLDLLPYEMISVSEGFIEANVNTQFNYTDDFTELYEIIDYYDNRNKPRSSFISFVTSNVEKVFGKDDEYETLLREKYNVNSKEEWEVFKTLSFLNDEDRKMYFYLKDKDESFAEQFLVAHEDQVNQQIGGLKALNEMQRYGMIEFNNQEVERRIAEVLKQNPSADVDQLRESYKYDFSCYKLKDGNTGKVIADYAVSLGFGVTDGIIQFDEGIINLFKADGIKSSEDYQRMYLAQMLSTGEGSLGLLDETYQYGAAAGQMLPVVVISYATGGVFQAFGASEAMAAAASSFAGKTALVASAFGNTKEQIYQNYEVSRTQAYLYAAASAGIELVTEEMGSISPIASENPRNFLEAFVNEAKEEALGSVMNAGLDATLMGEDFDLEEVAKQAAIEGLYGGLVGETFYGFNAIKTMNNAKKLGMSYKDMHDLLLEYGEVENPSHDLFNEMVVNKKINSLSYVELSNLKNDFASSSIKGVMTFEQFVLNLNIEKYKTNLNNTSSNTVISGINVGSVEVGETLSTESQETVIIEQNVDDVIEDVANINVDNVEGIKKIEIPVDDIISKYGSKAEDVIKTLSSDIFYNEDGLLVINVTSKLEGDVYTSPTTVTNDEKVLIHATDFFPDNHMILNNYDGNKTFIQTYSINGMDSDIEYHNHRHTVHFTQNGLVKNNDGGNWDGLPYIILEPYNNHSSEIINNSTSDSYTGNSVELSDKAVVLIQKDAYLSLTDVQKKQYNFVLFEGDGSAALNEYLLLNGYPIFNIESTDGSHSHSNQKVFEDCLNKRDIMLKIMGNEVNGSVNLENNSISQIMRFMQLFNDGAIKKDNFTKEQLIKYLSPTRNYEQAMQFISENYIDNHDGTYSQYSQSYFQDGYFANYSLRDFLYVCGLNVDENGSYYFMSDEELLNDTNYLEFYKSNNSFSEINDERMNMIDGLIKKYDNFSKNGDINNTFKSLLYVLDNNYNYSLSAKIDTINDFIKSLNSEELYANRETIINVVGKNLFLSYLKDCNIDLIVNDIESFFPSEASLDEKVEVLLLKSDNKAVQSLIKSNPAYYNKIIELYKNGNINNLDVKNSSFINNLIDSLDITVRKTKISQKEYVEQLKKKYPEAKYGSDYQIIKNKDGSYCVVWNDFYMYKKSLLDSTQEIYNKASEDVKRALVCYISTSDYNSYSAMNGLLRGSLFTFNDEGKIDFVNIKHLLDDSTKLDIYDFLQKSNEFKTIEDFLNTVKSEMLDINQFIRENPLEDPLVTFRGVSNSTIESIYGIEPGKLSNMTLKELKAALKGKEIYQDRGFLSTSVTQSAYTIRESDVVLEFRNAEGTPALDLKRFGGMSGEEEVLIAPNVRYKMNDVVLLPDGRFKIIFETDTAYSFSEGNQATIDAINSINYTSNDLKEMDNGYLVTNALDEYRLTWGDIENKSKVINSLTEEQQLLFIKSLSTNECIHIMEDNIHINNPKVFVNLLNTVVSQGLGKSLNVFSKFINSSYYSEIINEYGSEELKSLVSSYSNIDLNNIDEINYFIEKINYDNDIELQIGIDVLKQHLKNEIEQSQFKERAGYYSYMDLLAYLDSNSIIKYDDKTKLLTGIINSDESLRQDIYDVASLELSVLKNSYNFSDEEIQNIKDSLLGSNFVKNGIVNKDLKWDDFVTMLDKRMESLIRQEMNSGKEPVLWGAFPNETHSTLDKKYITVSNTSIGDVGFFEGVFTSWKGNKQNKSVKDLWSKLSKSYIDSFSDQISDGKIKYLYPAGIDVTDSFGEIFREIELPELIYLGNVDKIELIKTDPQTMEEISSVEVDIIELVNQMDTEYALSLIDDFFLEDKNLCNKYYQRFLMKVKEAMKNE